MPAVKLPVVVRAPHMKGWEAERERRTPCDLEVLWKENSYCKYGQGNLCPQSGRRKHWRLGKNWAKTEVCLVWEDLKSVWGAGALGLWGAGMDCVELQDREWGQPSFCCIYFFWNTGHMFLFQIFIAFLLFAMVTLLCSWESCHFMQYLKGKKGFCLKYKWSSSSWGQN